MKLHIFGTCSGTEPMPGRHHVSFAIDYNDRLYWFDAGESCSYTAHNMGVDLMRIQKICISHTHMDHVGGLGNLLWNVRKLDYMHHNLRNRELELLIPDLHTWDGIRTMLLHTEGGFSCDFKISAREYTDGLLFEDGGIAVTALHNRHLPCGDDGCWRSFGFSIEAEGKKIVYSGDTRGVDDFAPLLSGCDLLLMETGHHNPVAIANELISRDIMPSKLAFIHHGRDILNNYDHYAALLKELLGDRVSILEDATTLNV